MSDRYRSVTIALGRAVVVAASMILAGAWQAGFGQMLVDPLTSEKVVAGEAAKKVAGGEFTKDGWRALKNGDRIVIELAGAQGLEGALEIDVRGLDWRQVNNAAQGKIHFLNMFSNPRGDHHCKDGGTKFDALWTLRAGGDGQGGARYGNNFKALWASRGAKFCEGDDYHEVVTRLPADWVWDAARTYTFRVTWSKAAGVWRVAVNGAPVFEGAWRNAVSPLQYIFIGKAADFDSFIGPRFSNLRVYETANAHEARRSRAPARQAARDRVIVSEDFTLGATRGRRPFAPGEFTKEGWRVSSERSQIKYDLGRFYQKGRIEFDIKGPLEQQPKRVIFAAWNQESGTSVGRDLNGAMMHVRLFEGGLMFMLVNIAGGRSIEVKTGPLRWEDKWYRITATWDTTGGPCELWRDGELLKRERYSAPFAGLRWAFIGCDNYAPGYISTPGVVYRRLRLEAAATSDPLAQPATDATDTSAIDRELCAKGNGIACAKLGLQLYRRPATRREAAPLLEQACAGRPVAAACLTLGQMYFTGDEVARDERKAAALFARACEHGRVHQCRQLADMHHAGRGAPKDAAQAAAFERLACTRIDAEECAK